MSGRMEYLAEPAASPRHAAALRERFIDAMAELAPGVSVVTAIGLGGKPVGATVTSAVSASADPPIISVSLSRCDRSLASILVKKAFAVNVLTSDGHAVARVFASGTADKFKDTGWELTRLGLPWLPSVCAYAAVCRLMTAVPVGDHLLLLSDK